MLLLILQHAADVFAYNVKLYIDYTARLYGMEIGMLEGIRDNGYLEGIVSRIAHRETSSLC